MANSRSPLFYPPRLNPFLVAFVQWVSPLVAHLHYKFDLVVSPESLERLRSLKDQRCILLPNHPTFHDPPVIFTLSGRAGMPFYYLSAHEPFRGSLGPWLQRLGVYSIRRGAGDRASIAQTLELLARPDCKLVVFAESGCSFQNDTVMPFRTGILQMAFQVMNKLQRQDQTVPDLYAVPISLKYRYTQDMTAVIDQTLHSLEQALQISPEGEFYPRLRAIAEQVLQKIEKEYGFEILTELTWDERITRLKMDVLQTCEQHLGLASQPTDPDRDRVYRIQLALEEEPNQEWAEPWNRDAIARAAVRILNFDAIYDGYVAAKPTPERFLDTLVRLERDVFNIDQPVVKSPRQAHVYVDQPINLKDWFDEYQTDKSTTIVRLGETLQQAVQEKLDWLASKL